MDGQALLDLEDPLWDLDSSRRGGTYLFWFLCSGCAKLRMVKDTRVDE